MTGTPAYPLCAFPVIISHFPVGAAAALNFLPVIDDCLNDEGIDMMNSLEEGLDGSK